ncbi:hypothetical protein [Aggregatibacter kilianii]|uniref:hypothetical protein n=1 Tax=Aggregatibacter kilianii TaxID=2025884 RepID=UPI000D657144|nr:hypothetical protein [Aggregatibacter kilianii]
MTESKTNEDIGTHLSIIKKGEFGEQVASYINLNLLYDEHEGYLKPQFYSIDKITDTILTNSDLVFVLSDELTKEEWEKIANSVSSFVIVFGCTNPSPEMNFNGCFIDSSSIELCSKVAEAIINSSWAAFSHPLMYADLYYFFTTYGKTNFAVHVNASSEDVVNELLKQLSEKNMPLERATGLFLHIAKSKTADRSMLKEICNHIDTINNHLEDKKLSQESIILYSSTLLERLQGMETEITAIVTF